MKLIADWRKAHKMRSVQVAGVAGAVAAGLAMSGAIVPWLGLIPEWAVFAGGAVICVLVIVARLEDQKL